MLWLDEVYQRERIQDELNAAQQATERNALLAELPPPNKPRRVRQVIGGKLIEWGERLQETSAPAEFMTATNS